MSFRLRVRRPFQTFSRVNESGNFIVATYEDKLFDDVQVRKRELCFSCWSARLGLAKMNESKFGVDEAKMERLWGGNYFDPATKKWTAMNTGSATCKRGFFQFCYEPMSQSSELSNTCMNNQKDKLWSNVSKS